MARIGVKIREAREYIGMTQEELAKKLGYRGKSTIAKIETGANDIPLSKVKEFADALHTTPAFLMGWTDEDADIRHYVNDETMELAQEIHDNKDLRIMFSSARNLSPEDLRFAVEMLKRMEQMSK